MSPSVANPPPLQLQQYTEEEQKKILEYFRELKSEYIRYFLAGRGLPRSGTKTQLLLNIKEEIESGGLQYEDLVNFIDTIIPWGKQHVYLYDGPETDVENWRDEGYCHQRLQVSNVIYLLREKLPLILPKRLSISSIQYSPGEELQILAVQRRDYSMRHPEYDENLNVDGLQIERQAYIREVLRGIIIFNWNLITNQARLQISQLPSKGDYEKAEENFARLTRPWLPFNLFNKLELRRSIARLNELESDGNPDARSHGLSWRTTGGRAIIAKSPTSHDSVLGETVIDNLMTQVRRSGIGHLGNFYWLPKTGTPLEKEIHTIIVGNKKRINFTTPNKKEDFEYVLSRIRDMCY
jgi:hypothetical protein